MPQVSLYAIDCALLRSAKPSHEALRQTFSIDVSVGNFLRKIVWAAFLVTTGIGTGYAASPVAVEASHGIVVTSQRLASGAGAEMFHTGGNAVDAAVAAAYAEAVVNPCCGNIGGGGFIVLHLVGSGDHSINFRETAPAAATADMYLDDAGNVVKGSSLSGYKAVGVPGTVMGLDTALRKYGKLPRAKVMEPAIRLAREGFILTRGDTDILDFATERFRKEPGLARVFLRSDGSQLQPGDRLVQTDLANTLEDIAKGGSDAFYKGRIPTDVEAASRAGGGLLTAADFATYTVTESSPLSCTYRGAAILSVPPPSSGDVTMCEILNVLEGYDMRALGFHSAESVHLMVEAMRYAYKDRNNVLGDPAFTHNPVDELLSLAHAASIRAQIKPDKATPSQEVVPATSHERPETTHISVLDSHGNAVSLTYTINGFFGAGVIAGNTGFFLNNEMDDFTVKPGVPNLFGLVQGQTNAIAPGKRPLSSMAPTIVLRDGKVMLALGSPGGPRIITITLETLMNVLDYGMEPQEAVDAPRIHHQWLPDVVFAEPFALSPDTQKLLAQMGYKITEQRPWGAAELAALGPSAPMAQMGTTSKSDSTLTRPMRPGLLYGANDDRRPAGAAIGE
jgi:gamma-glutamyltranspeptidase / glutathione hydrolase